MSKADRQLIRVVDHNCQATGRQVRRRLGFPSLARIFMLSHASPNMSPPLQRRTRWPLAAMRASSSRRRPRRMAPCLVSLGCWCGWLVGWFRDECLLVVVAAWWAQEGWHRAWAGWLLLDSLLQGCLEPEHVPHPTCCLLRKTTPSRMLGALPLLVACSPLRPCPPTAMQTGRKRHACVPLNVQLKGTGTAAAHAPQHI